MLARCEKRHALFLQGGGCRFFSRLARKLADLGVDTSKIHLCFGDHLFWHGVKGTSYRGSLQDWKQYIAGYILKYGVTDIVLFSDSRPYHVVATEVAKGLNVNVFVFENGYIRPDWVTLEQGGVNGRSSFPSDPDEIHQLSEQTRRWPRSYVKGGKVKPLRLYFGDTIFHGLNFLTSFAYPNYTGFRNVSAIDESIGWVKKAFYRLGKVKRSRKVLVRLLSEDTTFFFYPLQLEHDYQLKVDSPYKSINQASNEIIASFAKHAPSDAKLLVKNHPLDNNIIDREVETAKLARQHGVEDRVLFIEAGHNPTILDKTVGMVTINSTMGTSALFHEVPICVLGNAVYKIDDLAHKGGLASFWQAPQQPDKEFFQVFRHALIVHCQLRGNLTDRNPQAWIYEHAVIKFFSTEYRLPAVTGTIMDPADIEAIDEPMKPQQPHTTDALPTS